MTEAPSIAFHTLGCKLNFSESSTLARQMEQEGFRKRDFDEQADVYVINTCSVTDNADKECRYLVRQIQRRAPEAFVVITGCYAQLKPAEIAGIPGVNLVLGAAEKFNLASHLRDLTRNPGAARISSCEIGEVGGFHASHSSGDRTRSFMKVQDGCDYTCTFCTIPMARGRSRSDTVANVVAEARRIAEKGVREIVLTGINLGDFGKGHEGDKRRTEDFHQLMLALDEVQEIDRFRISSIEPNLLTDGIITDVAKSTRFMPHFHIPLQSGSDTILGQMKRRYRRDLYASRVEHIRSVMPHGAIGVDVIVGFPGEGEKEFRETHDFLESLDVSYLHVFTYSERPNTEAISMGPVVPHQERNERNKTLRQLSFFKQRHFHDRHLGQTRKVLFEKQEQGGLMEGWTDNYIRVTTPYDPALVNRVVDWDLR